MERKTVHNHKGFDIDVSPDSDEKGLNFIIYDKDNNVYLNEVVRNVRARLKTVNASCFFIDLHLLNYKNLQKESLIPTKKEIITLYDLEKNHILDTLKYFNGNKAKTARALGVNVQTIYKRLKQYGDLS